MSTRRALARAGWAGVAAVTLRGITGSRQVFSSLAWLSRDQQPGQSPDGGQGRHLVVIVPLLREQRLIADTVCRMTDFASGWLDASVALVTTEREHADRRAAALRLPSIAGALSRGRSVAGVRAVLPRDRLEALTAHAGQSADHCLRAVQAAFEALESTPDMAARLAGDGGWPVRVRHYHLPDPAGIMAGQVNYAARAELRRLGRAGIDPTRVWLAVYNADSQPSPATLPAVARLLDMHPDAQIIQQPAVFTASPGGDMAADGAALLQSRWTLAREIPRLRRQAALARATPGQARQILPLAHCVGHGLFIRADTFIRFGGFPTQTMNEDLPLGYLACAAGVPIDPLPVLELADSPPAIVDVIRQARQWFWSYPQYPAAARLAAGYGLGSSRTRAVLAAQGLARGALWLSQSPAIVAALALPVTARHTKTAAVAVVGALAAYYGVPFAALACHLHRCGAEVRCGPRELAGGLAACLVSSVGPWWCLGQVARAKITGTPYIHSKTER
jgi:Glycosyl transferase family group 2